MADARQVPGRRKATGALKLVHEVFAKDKDAQAAYLREFSEAKKSNRELAGYLSKARCPPASVSVNPTLAGWLAGWLAAFGTRASLQSCQDQVLARASGASCKSWQLSPYRCLHMSVAPCCTTARSACPCDQTQAQLALPGGAGGERPQPAQGSGLFRRMCLNRPAVWQTAVCWTR